MTCWLIALRLQLNMSDSFVIEQGLTDSISGLSSGMTLDAVTGKIANDISWDGVSVRVV